MFPSSEPMTTEERAVFEQIYPMSREKPISRIALVNRVNKNAELRMSERRLREHIKELRRKGILILSMPGTGGGYFMAKTREDYEAFQREEFEAKILDMLETKKAMDLAASKQFGQVEQMRLEFKVQGY